MIARQAMSRAAAISEANTPIRNIARIMQRRTPAQLSSAAGTAC